MTVQRWGITFDMHVLVECNIIAAEKMQIAKKLSDGILEK